MEKLQLVDDEDSLNLSPINFFQLSFDCFYIKENFPALTLKNLKKYQVPLVTDITGEDHFADLSMGWNEEGLEFFVYIQEKIKEVSYPQIMRGDSVELFIDTRDIKTSGFNTKFCHHFFFLPESFEGIHAGEITHFRTEDAHELCQADELKVKVQKKFSSYLMNIWIPRSCLHGYDASQFNRLGFTYRINRFNDTPQHFSVLSKEYQLEQQPSLWGTVKLV